MEIICLESSVLIDFYRKKDKRKCLLFKIGAHFEFCLPSIVKYEVLRGDKKDAATWLIFINSMNVLAFDDDCAIKAASIYKDLKAKIF